MNLQQLIQFVRKPSTLWAIFAVIVVSANTCLGYKWWASQRRPGIDFAQPKPPEKIRPESFLAQHWDQFHRLHLLTTKLHTKGLTDDDISELKDLAHYHKDFVTRQKAVLLLAEIGDIDKRKELIEFISERLGDDHWSVRGGAAKALAIMGARERIPEIVPLLKSESRIERQAVAQALNSLGHFVNVR